MDSDSSEIFVLDTVLSAAGRYFPFLCKGPKPEVATPVIIESDRGTTVGWIGLPARPATSDDVKSLPWITRLASDEDLLQNDRNREREDAAFRLCLQQIKIHRLEMKLVRVQFILPATKAIFYFTADGRVDFRALVRDLASELRMRIEMRQIGVRDETKILGGVGHCGRELCCSTWLRNFVPVSIRMAKDQNLALNPQKVSGACGRLLCCLAYEHETYVELKKGLPKVGKRVNSTAGVGRVSNLEILKQRFVVELDDGGRVLLGPDDLLPLNEELFPEEPEEEEGASGKGDSKSTSDRNDGEFDI